MDTGMSVFIVVAFLSVFYVFPAFYTGIYRRIKNVKELEKKNRELNLEIIENEKLIKEQLIQKDEIDTLEKENAEYVVKIREHTETIFRLNRQVSTLQMRVDGLVRKLKEKDSVLALQSEQEFQVYNLEKENVEYLNTIRSHTDTIRRLTIQNNDLKKCCEELRKQPSKIADLEKEKHELITQLRSLEKKNSKLAEELTCKEQQVLRWEATLNAEETRANNLKKQLKNANETIDDLSNEIYDKDQEIMNLNRCLMEQDNNIIQLQREKTWGNLFKNYGKVLKHLLPEQQELINYPKLEKQHVYFSKKYGKAFHSVDWCYTIENSDEIECCTYDEAVEQKLRPCSKCINPKEA